jgi:hypothetical protein
MFKLALIVILVPLAVVFLVHSRQRGYWLGFPPRKRSSRRKGKTTR